MITMVRVTLLCAAICLAAGPACAQELIIYPAKGQNEQQTEKDKYECYSWAKGQTGFDPMQAPPAPPPQKESKSVAGSTVKGAAGGALLGVGIGAIAGDAGKGAAIGALAGGAFTGMRSHKQNKQAEEEQKQKEQAQTAQYSQNRGAYNRAYGACLEGRGYTVK